MSGFWARPITAVKGAMSMGSGTAQRAIAGQRPPKATGEGARFDILVNRGVSTTVLISLVGDHDADAAGTFARIARGELPHCDRLIVDFSSTEVLDADVISALIEVAVQARTQGATLQIVSQEYTYAHDVLELFGILDRLDRTDRVSIAR